MINHCCTQCTNMKNVVAIGHFELAIFEWQSVRMVFIFLSLAADETATIINEQRDSTMRAAADRTAGLISSSDATANNVARNSDIYIYKYITTTLITSFFCPHIFQWITEYHNEIVISNSCHFPYECVRCLGVHVTRLDDVQLVCLCVYLYQNDTTNSAKTEHFYSFYYISNGWPIHAANMSNVFAHTQYKFHHHARSPIHIIQIGYI